MSDLLAEMQAPWRGRRFIHITYPDSAWFQTWSRRPRNVFGIHGIIWHHHFFASQFSLCFSFSSITLLSFFLCLLWFPAIPFFFYLCGKLMWLLKNFGYIFCFWRIRMFEDLFYFDLVTWRLYTLFFCLQKDRSSAYLEAVRICGLCLACLILLLPHSSDLALDLLH